MNSRHSKFRQICLAAMAATFLCAGASLAADNTSSPKIGVVNFKTAIEESKAGKKEQANFEALKKQMEAILEEREKSFDELSAKLNDPDYLDSLSNEAENELKHKFRIATQENSQLQSQYYQTLNQANMKILQELNDLVAEASKQYAKEGQFDVILNDDGCFFFAAPLNVTKDVVRIMDNKTDKDSKEVTKG